MTRPSLLAANAVFALALALAATTSAETLRPLVTEDVNTLADSELEVQLAVEVLSDFASPVQPLDGSLVRAPVLGVNFGLGGRTEIQTRLPLRQFFHPTEAPSRSATGDLTIATKVRIFGGSGVVPGLGARMVVKLPNLNETSAIGTDETDVTVELLTGIAIAGASIQANLGYAILGDPAVTASQNDKVVLGAGFFLPVGRFDLGADLHGIRWGDSTRDDEWTALAGAATPVGSFRIDAGAGVASRGGDHSFYFTAGAGTVIKLRRR
jgi:hypothetical protein